MLRAAPIHLHDNPVKNMDVLDINAIVPQTTTCLTNPVKNVDVLDI